MTREAPTAFRDGANNLKVLYGGSVHLAIPAVARDGDGKGTRLPIVMLLPYLTLTISRKFS